MTSQDTTLIVSAGLLALWWLWKHPAAAKGLGLVVLVGLVCFGVAHAQTRAGRDHADATGGNDTTVCSALLLQAQKIAIMKLVGDMPAKLPVGLS